ncbi:S9 family peptidase [Paenibacillus humicola]|uniref:S9 family peptidase n=1 Tax=Paenibacillus humicola TaxID=3110540 RepID=UPI00237B37A5|nr:DPP IV N-terminal domain-containing protein [Paenibacillus humicola]
MDRYTAPQVERGTYARAERFLPENAKKLAFRLDISPNWISGGERFWYRVQTSQGKRFMLVDTVKAVRRPVFDHTRLAAALSEASGRIYDGNQLPFDEIEMAADGGTVIVATPDSKWKCNLSAYECSLIEEDGKAGAEEAVSADGRWAAFVRDSNLFVRSLAGGEEIQLTKDGEADRQYGLPLPSPLAAAGLAQPSGPAVVWSPDSTRLLTYRIDARESGRLHLIQASPSDGSLRPKVYSYVYPLPGDENPPVAEPLICRIPGGEAAIVDIEPLPILYYGAPRHPVWWESDGGEQLYLLYRRRGFRTIALYRIDPETGSCRSVLEETAETGWDPRVSYWPDTHNVRVLSGGEEIVWYSHRDGWGHLYLYEGSEGRLKNRITSGPWVVYDVLCVDHSQRLVYFTAAGRESGRDPYFRHLYRVKLDGTGLQLLTPEDADHEISFSPSGSCFVDTYSRVDLPPVTVLRQADGSPVMTLEEAEIEPLLAAGWKYPERFCAKARDGVTDIYGVVFRPTNFDPSKRYPVIEGNYSGPQAVRAPRAFAGGRDGTAQFWHDQALAELGFIVVAVDGLGMSYRSKAFLDFSYRNLGDAGLPDHIAALRQLADRYPYFDLERTGIYGYSAGGYAAARAILAHPDFYKVSVAWAGNHDHMLDKAGWIERYMGLPVGDHYRESANAALAANLKGKLFLMHGEMDENVPAASTIRLASALIKANKDFDLLILPDAAHGSGNHPYVTRRRWDYFVRHLQLAEPPDDYRIQG